VFYFAAPAVASVGLGGLQQMAVVLLAFQPASRAENRVPTCECQYNTWKVLTPRPRRKRQSILGYRRFW
jgi:hypothetical protein